VKFELKALSGKINDLDWDFESKRILAVGEGKDKFGVAFLWDSGSSVGEIAGHSKSVNSVSLKRDRPFRAVTGSDDMTVNFYHGVPFKFNRSLKDHSRFVQAVRYSPKGDLFLSAASDSSIFLYEGKNGDKVHELKGHTGSVYSCSWSPDGSQILSGSGDMTAKIWDVQTQQVVHTFQFKEKSTFEQQQVGTLWSGSWLVSCSLNGDLNYLDPRAGSVVRVLSGHQRGITSLTATPDKKLVTGSYDGKIFRWECGSADAFEYKGHSNQVVGLKYDNGIHSCGMDDVYQVAGSLPMYL
jgi:WD40 repeat protein